MRRLRHSLALHPISGSGRGRSPAAGGPTSRARWVHAGAVRRPAEKLSGRKAGDARRRGAGGSTLQRMTVIVHRDVAARGVRLRVTEEGDGPRIVLLHGLFVDHRTWDGV